VKQIALLKAALQNLVHVNQTPVSCTVWDRSVLKDILRKAHILPVGKGWGRTAQGSLCPCHAVY